MRVLGGVLFLIILTGSAFADTETLDLSSISSSLNLDNVTLTDLDEDASACPDAGDGATATGDNVPTDIYGLFADPSQGLTDGADLQTFQILCSKYDGTGTPTVRIELWENGGLIRADSERGVTTMRPGCQRVTFTWNATEITNPNNIEIKVFGTEVGGSPTGRASVDILAIEWFATTSAAATSTPTPTSTDTPTNTPTSTVTPTATPTFSVDLVYVDPDAGGLGNGDSWGDAYTTIGTCMSTEGRNLVATNERMDVSIRSSSGGDDTADINITGFITGSVNFIRMTVVQNHDGTWDESIYTFKPSGNAWMDIDEAYTELINMQVGVSDFGGGRLGIDTSTDGNAGILIDNCLVWGDHDSDSNFGAWGITLGQTSGNFYVRNCIVWDLGTEGITEGGSTVYYIYNNTVVGVDDGAAGGEGISGYGSDIVGKNNIVQDSGNVDHIGAWAAGSTDNITSDATCKGSNPQTSVILTFANKASDDFHLDSGDSEAIAQGADLDEDGSLPVTDDIDGDLRDTSTPDIGADEFVAVGGAGVQQVYYFGLRSN